MQLSVCEFVCRDGLTSSQYFIRVPVYRISRRFFSAFILPKLFNKLQRPIALARGRDALYTYILRITRRRRWEIGLGRNARVLQTPPPRRRLLLAFLIKGFQTTKRINLLRYKPPLRFTYIYYFYVGICTFYYV